MRSIFSLNKKAKDYHHPTTPYKTPVTKLKLRGDIAHCVNSDILSTRLECINDRIIICSNISSAKSNNRDFVFTPRSYSVEQTIIECYQPQKLPAIKSLIEINNERIAFIKAEREKLKQTILHLISETNNYIANENADGAKRLIGIAKKKLASLKDDDVKTLLSQSQSDYNELLNRLEQQRIEREALERLRKIEAEIEQKISTIDHYINAGQDNLADNGLVSLAKLLSTLPNEKHTSRYNTLKQRLGELKENRRQQEERIRKERIRREQEEQRLKRLKEQRKKAAQEELIRHTKEYKSDMAEISELFKEKGVIYLYHFTSEKNLQSIRDNGGLFSWDYCERNNITIPDQGGNSDSKALDRGKGWQDYVRLSFCEIHPMALKLKYAGKKMKKLLVKIDVAYFKTTIFTNMNATDNMCKHGESCTFLQTKVNFKDTNAGYPIEDTTIKKHKQAEIMIKRYIPIEYIVNIDNPGTI